MRISFRFKFDIRLMKILLAGNVVVPVLVLVFVVA